MERQEHIEGDDQVCLLCVNREGRAVVLAAALALATDRTAWARVWTDGGPGSA
jgi:general stress protein 26